MVKRLLALSTMVCALFFSCAHSVASTLISAQTVSSQHMLVQSTEASADLGSTLVAAVDSASFNSMSESNVLAEFALRVSGLQHQSGGELSTATSLYDHTASYLPRVTSERRGLATKNSNNGVQWNETGTLLLVALGFTALRLSRRRIKFTRIASERNSPTSRQTAIFNALAGAFELKSAQHRHLTDQQHTPSAIASTDDTETAAPLRATDTTTAHSANKNPYPELAQSVQALEDLADEMAQLA